MITRRSDVSKVMIFTVLMLILACGWPGDQLGAYQVDFLGAIL
jgi:hypothetical protein